MKGLFRIVILYFETSSRKGYGNKWIIVLALSGAKSIKFCFSVIFRINSNLYKYIFFLVKQINRQLIAVLQFVISTAAGFLFGFMGIELILNTTFDLGFKLLLGIIFALVIALAEIYFLAKTLTEDYEPLNLNVKAHKD